MFEPTGPRSAGNGEGVHVEIRSRHAILYRDKDRTLVVRHDLGKSDNQYIAYIELPKGWAIPAGAMLEGPEREIVSAHLTDALRAIDLKVEFARPGD